MSEEKLQRESGPVIVDPEMQVIPEDDDPIYYLKGFKEFCHIFPHAMSGLYWDNCSYEQRILKICHTVDDLIFYSNHILKGLQREREESIAADNSIKEDLEAAVEELKRLIEDTKAVLEEALAAEAAARETADLEEKKAREAADLMLQSNIDAEVTARAEAITTVLAALNEEIQTRASADTAINDRIDSEAAARAAADETEAVARKAADETEAVARKAADEALDAEIDSLYVDCTVVVEGDTAEIYHNLLKGV